ncbi:MAG: hypothetical protein QM757_32745 [Paludibaculum sp.]
MLAAESKKLMGGDVQGAPADQGWIQKMLAGYASQAKPEDTLVLLLIGHGNLDGSQFKFNVPGPDMTVDELRGWWTASRASNWW